MLNTQKHTYMRYSPNFFSHLCLHKIMSIVITEYKITPNYFVPLAILCRVHKNNSMK